VFNAYRQKKKANAEISKQNRIIDEQRNVVENKNKEILDSIYYARRIQMAQIPSEGQVSQMLRKIKK
jgi:hypothetical protein